MTIDPRISAAAFERSIVRSRLRLRALVMLSSLGEAFPRQLAKAIGVDASRLCSLMHGDGEDYAKDLALVALGLAQERETPHGRVYAITPTGRRKARQLSARDVRRERAREANRETRFPRVWPRPGEATDAGAPTPVVPPDTSSFRWSSEA